MMMMMMAIRHHGNRCDLINWLIVNPHFFTLGWGNCRAKWKPKQLRPSCRFIHIQTLVEKRHKVLKIIPFDSAKLGSRKHSSCVLASSSLNQASLEEVVTCRRHYCSNNLPRYWCLHWWGCFCWRHLQPRQSAFTLNQSRSFMNESWWSFIRCLLWWWPVVEAEVRFFTWMNWQKHKLKSKSPLGKNFLDHFFISNKIWNSSLRLNVRSVVWLF